MKIIPILFLLVLTSCGGLPVDNSPSPFDSGLRTVEMKSSCGFDVGVHGCHFNINTDMQNSFLKIPVAHKGEIEIVSKRCSYSTSRRFSGTGSISFSWAELMGSMNSDEFACLFSIKLKIDGVRSMKGEFLLADREGFSSLGMSLFKKSYQGVAGFQLRNVSESSRLYLDVSDQASYFISGCGSEISGIGNEIAFKSFTNNENCIYEIAVRDQGKKFIGSLNLVYYSNEYKDLAYPSIEIRKKSIIIGEDIVGFISLNGKWKKSNKIKGYLRERNEIRMLTQNGRYLLLIVDKKGEYLWTSSKI